MGSTTLLQWNSTQNKTWTKKSETTQKTKPKFKFTISFKTSLYNSGQQHKIIFSNSILKLLYNSLRVLQLFNHIFSM